MSEDFAAPSGAPSGGEAGIMDALLREADASCAEAAPNPMVAAAVVRDGLVVGRGVHSHAALDHAELVALREAGAGARGATLLVTLEPCCSTGRTAPCTDAIVAAGVARVVACCADPDPRHSGRGFGALRRAGVEVVTGARREEAVRLNAAFFARVTTGRPLVTVKIAMSVDGRVAAASAESQWLTSDVTRARAHELRRRSGAVLVGVGTVLADDPQLTARGGGGLAAQPVRCVIDPGLRTPPTARLLAPPAPRETGGATILFTREGWPEDARGLLRGRALEAAGATIVELPPAPEGEAGLDLRPLLEVLGCRSVNALLVEGGGVTAGRFLDAGLVDRVELHVAPLILGGLGTRASFESFGTARLEDAVRLRRLVVDRSGPDVVFAADVVGGFDPTDMALRLAALEAEG